MFAVAVALSLTATDARPARWAADLASPRFADRAAAAEELERAGEAAVPALRAATQAADPEAAARAAELLARVLRRLASDRLVAPTLVRLPAEPATVGSALAALSKQTGWHFDLSDPTAGAAKLTPPAGPLPVWEAVRAVADAAGLDVVGVAPKGRPRPPETDSDRRRTRQRQDYEGAFEDALIRIAQNLDWSRQRAERNADPAERLRLLAEVRRQEDEIHALARLCGERSLRREVARLAALDPGPDPAGRVVLKPAAERPAVATFGGLRVEARPAPPAVAAGTAVGQAAVVVRVRGEPGRTVGRVDGVWVRRATADGKELARGPEAGPAGPLVALPAGNGSGQIRLTADGRADLSDTRLGHAVGVVGPAEAVVRVVAPPRVTRLTELFGTVRAVVLDDPVELLACGVPGTVAADGLRLSVELPNPADTWELDLTLSYDPTVVRPTGGRGVRFEPDTAANGFGGGGGFRRWNAGQAAEAVDRVAPTADGLTVLDAGGRVLDAAVTEARRADGVAGRVADRLTIRAAKAAYHGPPARVVFGGSRAVPVDVPFALADVPAAAGTATPDAGQ